MSTGWLLDTHVLLWFLKNSEQLSKRAKGVILDSSNKLYVSQASIWEIAIKISLKK